MHNFFRKIRGFTLAEVLITLVIIGVVAAITVPTIQANYLDSERKARVKKTFSTLNQSMIMVKADGGGYDIEVADGNDQALRRWYDEYLAPRLNTIKVCHASSAGCWNEGDTLYLNGSVASGSTAGVGLGGNILTAILSDGTFINIDGFSSGDVMSNFGVNTNGFDGYVIHFDINGARKPNTIGKDIFVVVFSENGFVPAYKDRSSDAIDSDCSRSGTGISCIMKYLRH